MPVKVEDETGYLNVYMREAAALSLAQADSKDDFVNLLAQEELFFPPRASIKLIRKPVKPSFASPGKDVVKELVSCFIVEAAEQPFEETPSKRSLELLGLLACADSQTDSCAPAHINMITKSPHYGLSIEYKVEGAIVKKQCTRVVALVAASTTSEMVQMNEGYQMTTKGVVDAMESAPDSVSQPATLISFCSLRSAPDYQLKAARGQKTQLAFVTIADILEDKGAEKVLLCESIEKIPTGDAESATRNFNRTIYFASLAAKAQGTKRNQVWTEEHSPANAGKCRRLGKSPTDDLLETYGQPQSA